MDLKTSRFFLMLISAPILTAVYACTGENLLSEQEKKSISTSSQLLAAKVEHPVRRPQLASGSGRLAFAVDNEVYVVHDGFYDHLLIGTGPQFGLDTVSITEEHVVVSFAPVSSWRHHYVARCALDSLECAYFDYQTPASAGVVSPEGHYIYLRSNTELAGMAKFTEQNFRQMPLTDVLDFGLLTAYDFETDKEYKILGCQNELQFVVGGLRAPTIEPSGELSFRSLYFAWFDERTNTSDGISTAPVGKTAHIVLRPDAINNEHCISAVNLVVPSPLDPVPTALQSFVESNTDPSFELIAAVGFEEEFVLFLKSSANADLFRIQTKAVDSGQLESAKFVLRNQKSFAQPR